jgi:hypothetical protein
VCQLPADGGALVPIGLIGRVCRQRLPRPHGVVAAQVAVATALTPWASPAYVGSAPPTGALQTIQTVSDALGERLGQGDLAGAAAACRSSLDGLRATGAAWAFHLLISTILTLVYVSLGTFVANTVPTFEVAHGAFARLGLQDPATQQLLRTVVRPRTAAGQYGSQCSVWETLSHGIPLPPAAEPAAAAPAGLSTPPAASLQQPLQLRTAAVQPAFEQLRRRLDKVAEDGRARKAAVRRGREEPVQPVAPVLPMGPALPVGPVGPVLPVVPVLPVWPVAPVGPWLPVAPVSPVAPTPPRPPVGPV